MSTQAKMVMWIGLFLIAMNIVVNWQTIRATIFGGGSSSGTDPGALPPDQCAKCNKLKPQFRAQCLADCRKGIIVPMSARV